jgi:hypothetical protein
MFKKTIVATGFLVAVGGGVIASLPASAQAPGKDDHTFRNDSSRSRNYAARHYHRNWNRNASSDETVNRIRLPINSTNTLTPTVNVSPVAAPTVTQAPAA